MNGINLDGNKVIFDLTIINEEIEKFNEETGHSLNTFDPAKDSFAGFIEMIQHYRQTVCESKKAFKSAIK
jgi:tetrahydromethanopterin S-methyltransferase subunit B